MYFRDERIDSNSLIVSSSWQGYKHTALQIQCVKLMEGFPGACASESVSVRCVGVNQIRLQLLTHVLFSSVNGGINRSDDTSLINVLDRVPKGTPLTTNWGGSGSLAKRAMKLLCLNIRDVQARGRVLNHGCR